MNSYYDFGAAMALVDNGLTKTAAGEGRLAELLSTLRSGAGKAWASPAGPAAMGAGLGTGAGALLGDEGGALRGALAGAGAGLGGELARRGGSSMLLPAEVGGLGGYFGAKGLQDLLGG